MNAILYIYKKKKKRFIFNYTYIFLSSLKDFQSINKLSGINNSCVNSFKHKTRHICKVGGGELHKYFLNKLYLTHCFIGMEIITIIRVQCWKIDGVQPTHELSLSPQDH